MGAAVILSFHLADVGPKAVLGILRNRPTAADAPGLRWGETVVCARFGGSRLTAPQPGRAALIAAWDDDAALDRFLATHPLAPRLADGWHVRLEPLRNAGSWPALPGLPTEERPVSPDEPVAVLTLGRPRLLRTIPFLRASKKAEDQVAADAAVLAGTGLARPPRLVATFSLWRSAAAMRAYALGQSGKGHLDALRAHRAKPFHHESTFARFRPYVPVGEWDGREPLAAARSGTRAELARG
jgi:hypothetical protein